MDPLASSVDELEASIAEVEMALRDHRAWLARWHRHVVCRTAPDPDLVAEDAHTICRFGRWYATLSAATAAGETWRRIGTLHQALHQHARAISLAVSEDAPVDARAYDALAGSAERFARQVLGAERALRDRLAQLDPLTGADTRRGLRARLERELAHASERATRVCIAMVDVDHFKRLNDDDGHRAGDALLRAVARCMREGVRPGDAVFRYGGDEFLVCLVDVGLDAAVEVLERIRRRVGALRHGARSPTLSVGVVEAALGDPVEVAIERADRALYTAKQAGRDRVVAEGGA